MAAGVRIDLALDDAALRRSLAEFVRRGSDLRPALDEIGQRLAASTLRRFETERDPEGRPWPPSARAKAEGGQTLSDTGRLRASITHVVGRDSVSVGTNVVYAAIHQFGGQTGPRVIRPRRAKALAFPGAGGEIVFRRSVRHPGSRVPRRAFLGLDGNDRRGVERVFGRYLAGAFR